MQNSNSHFSIPVETFLLDSVAERLAMAHFRHPHQVQNGRLVSVFCAHQVVHLQAPSFSVKSYRKCSGPCHPHRCSRTRPWQDLVAVRH